MKLTSLGAVFILAALVFTAAPTAMTQHVPKPAIVQTIAIPPLRGAVLFDITASRNEARITTTIEDFAPIFDRLRISGGEIGFGLIREDSDHPLIRCFIPAPPTPPTVAAPTGSGNLFLKANARKREDGERKKYEGKRRAWEADGNARINAFTVAIKPLLDESPTARSTDLTAAVERGDLMLAEPSVFTNATTAILVITDGYHNATAKTTPTMRSNARVAIVNGIGSLGALAHLTPPPLRFESTAAAARYLTSGGDAHDQ